VIIFHLSFDIFHLAICQQTELDRVKRSLQKRIPLDSNGK